MSDLQSLGNKVEFPTKYQPEILESVPYNPPLANRIVTVSLECPEFTSLCPYTGQPDFGVILIRYIPTGHLVESKSLKLYLGSFRNHGVFHEMAVQVIGEDLTKLLLDADPAKAR